MELAVRKKSSLDAGDTLLLYSDGVTEAANSAGDYFGEDRLVSILRESNARG
jgi:serine phosphatase RsbU (regulator of sigma subunit)